MIGDKTCWNKGYASESVLLVLNYAFRHINLLKMYVGVTAPSQASVKLLERNGYNTEAVFKDKLFVYGKYVDHIIMSLSQEEYLQRNPQPIIVKNL